VTAFRQSTFEGAFHATQGDGEQKGDGGRSDLCSTAEWIFYGAMDVVRDKTKDDPIKALKRAVDNVKPLLEVKSRRVGGATYQVPVEVNPARRQSLAIRWIIGYSSQRASEKQMLQKLANEVLDASNNRGGAVKKKEDTHKMAEANKAFAHYRW
jgi:small subunit ribosomal protein S7